LLKTVSSTARAAIAESTPAFATGRALASVVGTRRTYWCPPTFSRAGEDGPVASLIASVVELEVDAVAHGGHCVARHDGRVVFVRHTLPGERVVARITEGDDDSRFLRADAVEVLRAAPGRVERRCPHSGPGLCGGCDFQHVDLATQRGLLASVVREQLRRLAGIDYDVVVEAADDGDGLGWRTRVDFAVDRDGRLGLRRHRSHEVIAVDPCPIAHRALDDFSTERWPGSQVEAVVSSYGDRIAVVDEAGGVLPPLQLTGVVDASGRRLHGRPEVRERVHHREFRVSGAGFWQVHPAAAARLVDAVLEMAGVTAGSRVVDLYAGAGLFTAFLAEAVGSQGLVQSVESHRGAVRDARHNLRGLPVQIVHGKVEPALRRGQLSGPCDVVVLDPPRTGARSRVVEGIAGLAPARVVYVACDPAALARDVETFGRYGYRLERLRAFALFPMTHHVECVALLTKIGSDPR
jgi:tRNA/tmRNA/rRNA uracil-C5-methylase (TrmA/RlmC/RlmD family)